MYGLFPINSKPMTIKKMIYKYTSTQAEKTFTMTVDCLGVKETYLKKFDI